MTNRISDRRDIKVSTVISCKRCSRHRVFAFCYRNERRSKLMEVSRTNVRFEIKIYFSEPRVRVVVWPIWHTVVRNRIAWRLRSFGYFLSFFLLDSNFLVTRRRKSKLYAYASFSHRLTSLLIDRVLTRYETIMRYIDDSCKCNKI